MASLFLEMISITFVDLMSTRNCRTSVNFIPARDTYLKIWAHLDNFYFHCLMGGGGTKGKSSKSLPRLSIVFWIFFPLVPLWNNKNKSCLNELKFWEASEKHMLKMSAFLFHVERRNLPRSPYLWPRWSGPFWAGILLCCHSLIEWQFENTKIDTNLTVQVVVT